MPTSTGSIDVEISNILLDRVIAENDQVCIIIPITVFETMIKTIVKNKQFYDDIEREISE